MKRLITLGSLAAWLTMMLSSYALAVDSAEAFGFGNLPAGRNYKPLLLITWQLPSPKPALAPNLYYDNLVFNRSQFPSVNNYFWENSGKNFLWTRAGVLGPVILTSQEAATLAAIHSIDNPSEGVDRFSVDSGAGIAYLLQLVASKTGYNFAQWDKNNDHVIDNSELYIMIIGNFNDTGGGNRAIGAAGSGQSIPGQNGGPSVTLKGRVAGVDHQTSFTTFAHEASHSLGTVDLYGQSSLSQNLTLMGTTIFKDVNDMQTFHLDPWHKMQLGWSKPRIRSLRSGGIETLPAAQMLQSDAPIIYYDPIRGTSEFFVFEYRTQNSPNGSGYEGQVAGNGLVVWHVQQDGQHNAFDVPSLTVPGKPDKSVWSEGPDSLRPNSFIRGSSTVWTSTSPSPYLTWADGTQTRTRFLVRPFSAGDASITIEVLSEEDSWVNFSYPGKPSFPEDGAAQSPFNSLEEGVAGVGWGGFLNIRSGRSAATGQIKRPITKRMKLQAIGGQVTLGAP